VLPFDKEHIDIQAMLFENAGIFSHPEGH